MLVFTLPAISCSHCARAVTEAVHGVDPKAQVQVDVARRQVRVQTVGSRAAIVAALQAAGYPPAG